MTKENDKREYKDKVKKSQIINEEAKGKEASLNKTLHKVKSTKDESMNSTKKMKVNPNKLHKESVNTLNIKDTSSIQPQPLPDKVSSDDDFACTNCENKFKDPSGLANHSLACKQNTVKSNVSKQSIMEALENTDSNDTEENLPLSEDVEKISAEENIYCGEVVTLNRIFGGASESDAEDEEDQTIILQNGKNHQK